MSKCLFLIIILTPFFGIGQGSYAPNADAQGTSAIHKDSSVFIGWASSCITQRGPQNIANVGSPQVTAGDDYMATDKSGVNGVVSLGDGGIAVLTFAQPIVDGPGWDFAVFENSFANDFLELAFVEVSSDGVNFHRFNSHSEIQITTQVGTFGLTDATEINNLAGKYRGQFGTPFDLSDLNGIFGLDVQNITHIKVIDVVGSIAESFATYDAFGNKINDPYPTDFASGGFDLDAIGVINEQPLSVGNNQTEFLVYPNPASDKLFVKCQGEFVIEILNTSGSQVHSAIGVNELKVNIENLSQGMYYVQVNGTTKKLAVY